MPETSNKKVLLAITKSNWGGAQKYVYDLATALPSAGFEVVVIFGQGGELAEKLRAAGVRTIKIETLQRDVSFFKDLAVCRELIGIFQSEKPDVVHLNSTKMGGIGTVAARIARVPKIIFTAHAWAFNERKRNIISRATIAGLQWLTVILSHITIAVSQKTADQILAFPFISRKKIKVIYNGIAGLNGATDVDFVEKQEARRALLGDSATAQAAGAPVLAKLTDQLWLGTISELHPNKGLDIAISAFAQIADKFPNSKFVIVGAGEEKARLVTQIAVLGLTDRIFLTGFVAGASKYLKAFDIFTLTSRTEALPYVILEAGLAGLPIIASGVGGIPEIINSPDVGLLVPAAEGTPTSEKTLQSIAEAMTKLSDQPAVAEMIGKNLKQRIISEFSAEKMHLQTFALY